MSRWSSCWTRRAGTWPRTCRSSENITLYHLPPYAPELNPVERIWAYLPQPFHFTEALIECPMQSLRQVRPIDA
jgi:hypothetical protein